MSESKNAITKGDVNKMFGRALMYGASWNYERMQNLGFLYLMVPALRRVYGKDKSPEMGRAMKRHLEFFNTHQTAAPFIGGVAAAMEEKEGNAAGSAISGIKVGLMGPLAGVGDSLIWLTLVPICFSIGASYSQEGSLMGVLLALLLINVINVPLKYFGLKFGYTSGSKFIQESAARGTLDKITSMATALGLVLVGGLIPTMVSVVFGLSFTQGDLTVSLQDILTSLLPGVVPMLLTLAMCKLVRKGTSPVVLIVCVLVIAIALTMCGVLTTAA